jgi:AcrR family transcriptional regulator
VTTETTATAPRPVGRPPRVDREAIADAVLAIGLGRATMAAVADRLGISAAGLYYHVRNRKELLLLAAERTLAAVELPEDRGQHWATWLREWARYSHQALVSEPEVFRQYLEGAVATERVVEVADSVIRVLARHGFTPSEALAAWAAVGTLAVGAAAEGLGEAAATASGRPPAAEWHRVLAARPDDELPGARSATADMLTPDGPAAFEDELTTLLIGIAVRRGEPWQRLAEE